MQMTERNKLLLATEADAGRSLMEFVERQSTDSPFKVQLPISWLPDFADLPVCLTMFIRTYIICYQAAKQVERTE